MYVLFDDAKIVTMGKACKYSDGKNTSQRAFLTQIKDFVCGHTITLNFEV